MSDSAIQPLIEATQIQDRIQALGAEIREDHGDALITCIGVLKGSFVFMADLVRAIGGPVRCEFLGVASYRGVKSTGVVRITHDLRNSIQNQHCLLVEDIVDTGLTMRYLLELLELRKPKSLKVVTLLDKPANRKVEVSVDYIGFDIPDEFLVGYGLDMNELYRNLPYIGVYTP